MNKPCIFLLILFIGLPTIQFAQSPKNQLQSPKNQLKINLTALAVNNAQLTYEHSLGKRFTLGGSGNLGLGSNLPRLLTFRRLKDSDLQLTGSRFLSYSVLPQFKWYPSLSNRTIPHGFYVGGITRFRQIRYDASAVYPDPLGGDILFDLNTDLISLSAGIEVGYQIHFKRNFLLDFSFFGPRYTWHSFKLSSTATLSNEVIEALSEEANELLGVGIADPRIQIVDLNRRVGFSFAGYRYAVSFGYAF